MPNSTQLPFNQGYLSVSEEHRLYFAEYGCAEGPAVVVLHGGPGSGCHPSMLEWFNLAYHRVVLFDQRGAGKSLPKGLLAHNTTSDLVDDIECLRKDLQIARWVVVGGSWGTILGILYTGRYPGATSGLILRGIFLASKREMDWFFQSLRGLVPHGWARLTTGWTQTQKGSVLQTLTQLLLAGTPEEQRDAASRWEGYEDTVMRAMRGLPIAIASASGGNDSLICKYRLQSHYLSHSCFVAERALFRCAHRDINVPTVIIHGTHDWICAPENVLRLTRFMPQAEVRWVDKGTHTASDPAICDALRNAIYDMTVAI